jgi:hypothetical protein
VETIELSNDSMAWLNAHCNEPEPWVTKTVVEGVVLPKKTIFGIREIHGTVRQDDSRMGCLWPDNAVELQTTIAINGHLTSYCGSHVRVTIERLPDLPADG